MTPYSLNTPGPNSIQDQNQLLTSPNNHHSTSLSCPAFFHLRDQRKTGDIRELKHHDQQDNKRVFQGESSSNHQVLYNNSSFVSPQPVMPDPSCTACGHNLSFYKIEREEENKSSYGSAKWMSSKIRLKRKMMSSSDASSYNRNSITRVCADCNTSRTPLWRSGPKGPKSLCNACGIRQRKARKAMAEAANGFAASMDASTTTKTRVHHKEKKFRANHFGQFKNKCKVTTTSTTTASTSQAERKLHFKDFAISLSNSAIQQVFPRDEEVAKAALLLMDLSCGFVYF